MKTRGRPILALAGLLFLGSPSGARAGSVRFANGANGAAGGSAGASAAGAGLSATHLYEPISRGQVLSEISLHLGNLAQLGPAPSNGHGPWGALTPQLVAGYAQQALVPDGANASQSFARELLLAALSPPHGLAAPLDLALEPPRPEAGVSALASRVSSERERHGANGEGNGYGTLFAGLRGRFLHSGENPSSYDRRLEHEMAALFDGTVDAASLRLPAAPPEFSAQRLYSGPGHAKHLANGSQGRIFLGLWPSPSHPRGMRLVAFKVFPGGSERAMREFVAMQLVATSDHPGRQHVLEALEVVDADGRARSHLTASDPSFPSDGNAVLVTPYARLGSLERWIERNRAFWGGRAPAPALRLTPGSVLRIARQAALGLTALHAHAFAHQDVKPSNLLFDGDWSLRLADLGTADVLDTEPSAYSGTPAYAAPPLLRYLSGGGPFTIRPANDVYALALVLEEALLAGVLGLGFEDLPARHLERIRLDLLRGAEVLRLARPLWEIYRDLGGERRLPSDQESLLQRLSGLLAAKEEHPDAESFLRALP